MAGSSPIRWRRRIVVVAVAGAAVVLWRDRKLAGNARRYGLPG